jgi:hypothetical protein
MSRASASRFAARDGGLRRVRSVTAWSAAGSAGVAIAAALALVPSTASTASTGPHTQGIPSGESSPRGDVGADDHARAAAPRPRPSHTTEAPRLQPPTVPPAAVSGGSQHAASGGS